MINQLKIVTSFL